MTPKHIIHLLSGGLDSVTLLHQLVDEGHSVHCLLVDYDQPHKQELLWAKHHARARNCLFTTITLPSLGGLSDASWIVPNRNAILLAIAANLAVKANAETVTIGCNLDDADAFPDCRIEFIESVNASLKAAQLPVEVCTPFIAKRKWEIGALAREMGIKPSDVWTCYRGGPTQCGNCPACEKLKIAFA